MEKKTRKNEYIYATGKRKSAIATIRIYLNEKNEITVNNKTLNEYFGYKIYVNCAIEALNLLSLTSKYKITIHVKGGGKKGQAEAVRLGIARCLIKINPDYRKALRSNGLLTRDHRVKERKKPGLKRARKAPQWSKR